MVKRPPTPEFDQETRLFSVYQPYPLNPDFYDGPPRRMFARWIAECIGDYNELIAFYHKPSSRGMIILEITKSFKDHKVLLGEHSWRKMLKDPNSEEIDSLSQIFYSVYSTNRDLEKDGWKEIAIERNWFDKWVRGTGCFRSPYPESVWCTPPPEDITGKKICRVLPMGMKPPSPPKDDSEVVGSKAWVEKQKMTGKIDILTNTVAKLDIQKANEASTSMNELPKPQPQPATSPSPLTNTWFNRALPDIAKASKATSPRNEFPSTQSATSPDGIKKANSASGSSSSFPPTSSAARPAGLPSATGGGKPKWGKAIPVKQFSDPKTTGPPRNSKWKTVPAKTAGSASKSPWTEEPPKKPVNAWSKPLNIKTSERSKPPTPPNDTQWGSPLTQPLTIEPSSNSPSPYTPASDIRDFAMPTAESVPNEGPEEMLPELNFPVELWAKHSSSEPQPQQDWGDQPESFEDWMEPTDPKKEPVPPCPTHGTRCKKGICRDMSKIVRQREREKKEEERAAAKLRKSRNKKGKGEPKVVSNDEEGFEVETPDSEKKDSPHLGRLRGFEDAEGEAEKKKKEKAKDWDNDDGNEEIDEEDAAARAKEIVNDWHSDEETWD